MGNASDTSAVFASSISEEHDILMGSIYSVFCILSLMGNCILLLVAYHKRSTLKPAEFFIINLSISDLGMTLSLFPLAIPSSLTHRWLFGEITCQLYAMCGVLFGLCSLTNLTALSLVCCLKVASPAMVTSSPRSATRTGTARCVSQMDSRRATGRVCTALRRQPPVT
ncbi:opsin-5 [Etheostoma spectabile]|uniref:opsin-5 n=1 Tax=Etheostoma spectabile TaxID=54343 RepID=UPI0013AEE8FC|nr:opsin-5-like [Etheostoma spectabile]